MRLLCVVRRVFGVVASLMLGVAGLVQAGPLNDTGIDAVGRSGLSAGDEVDEEARPLSGSVQDAGYGRDAAARNGVLRKVGGSSGTVAGRPNGFDFTKIGTLGEALPANAQLGSGPGDWTCTFDNNTGLMWEIKVNDASHFRHMGHTYIPVLRGSRGANAPQIACHAPGSCEVQAFVDGVNATGLCGHHDWRVPSHRELNNLVDRGRSQPAIDPVYFPNTPATPFWTSTAVANYEEFWTTDFASGAAGTDIDQWAHAVRLVRVGR